MSVQELKEFVRSAQELFSRSKEDPCKVHQSLLVVSANWNSASFESDDYLVVHAVLNSLQRILVEAERFPDLSWAAVEVLSRISSTPAVCQYLIRSFNFMPILTKELTRVSQSVESNESKIRLLLELMQEITYGIEILWQESYLQPLVTTLKDLVCSTCSDSIVGPALGVLVNLCHGNLSVVGVITRTIHIKKLLKVILKSHKQSDSRIRVEVSKLILVLGEEVTDAELDVEFFMKTAAPSLVEALSLRNASRMRQILLFLEEILKNPKLGEFLHYSYCKKELESMLYIVENDDVPPDCLAAVLRYFTILIGREIAGDTCPLVAIFRLALGRAGERPCAVEALTLAATVVSRHAGTERNSESILNYLLDSLPTLLSFLNVSSLNVEVCEKLSALMNLLSESLKIVDTSVIVQNFEPSAFRTLFETLKKPELKNNNLFHVSIYTFYVKTLTFLSELSDKEASWLLFFNQLLQEEEVQMVLSVALYTGPEDIKKQVLSLTVSTAFSLECVPVMAKCMAKVNNLIVLAPGGQGERTENKSNSSLVNSSREASMSLSQENRVDSVLNKVERALAKDDSALTSNLIELYQIKINSLSESRSRLEKAQEAADARAYALREDLALAQSEFTRLHNLLPCLQMSIEEAKKDKSRLYAKITEAEAKANQVSRSLKTKSHEIARLNEEIDEIKEASSQELTKKNADIDRLNLELQELNSKLNVQEMAALKNEEALKKQLSDCKKEIDSKSLQIEQLKKDFVSQSNQMAKLEKSKNEVESKLGELKKHLSMISELSRKDI